MKYLFLALVILLSACVPQTELGPRAVVVGGPTEYRAPGLADSFQAELKAASSSQDIGFVSRGATAFQETHRDMYGSRAPLQVAYIARAKGAELAVLVGAPVFERSVSELRGSNPPKRLVTTAVQVRVVIYDPATAEPLATYDSRRFDAVRFEVGEDLVEEENDPDLQESLLRASRDLSSGVAADLALLAGRIEAERFVDYVCEDGTVLSVAYPSNRSATLRYQGQTFALNSVSSGSGARYAGGGLLWWSKGVGAGSEGSLFRWNEDEVEERLELCSAE